MSSVVRRETVGLSSVLPVATMGVVVVVGYGKAQLVLFRFASERGGSLACRMTPRLRLVWKRGPLAPVVVVVVGEGQVNLVYGRCNRPWGKSPKLCG